ncbi:MAG: hypothetical protein KA791_15665, partial [Flavobacteriales bacterium]|nr:hypothetical protein [Flavobacteriales bacterium]
MNTFRYSPSRIGQPIATLALLTMMVQTTRAQYVYIPDPAMRDWLNLNVPGVVNGDGNMDTTYAGIADFTDGAIITSNSNGPTDMTGLQYLHGLTRLNMMWLDIPGTVGDAFPPNLSILSLNALGPVFIPALPMNLEHLELVAGVPLDMPELPAGLESLTASGAWTGGAWATLPSQLRALSLTSMPVVSA